MIKKGIFLLLTVILFINISACNTTQEPYFPEPPKVNDFMVADWGMNKAKVQKAQLPEQEIYADETTMVYEIVKEYDTFQVYYYFTDDSLVLGEARVEMGTEVWSKRVPEMISSYDLFRKELIELYGDTLEEEYRVWLDKDPEYIEDSDMHNLYYQRLEYLSEWETDDSLMSLRLYYMNRDFKLVFQASMKGA